MASVGTHNCTLIDEQLKCYLLPVAYSVIFVVGLVGNGTALIIYVTKLRPWKSSSIIMVNLALNDLLYVLSLPFLVFYYSNRDTWLLGDFMCPFIRFSFHFNLYGSILFLTCHAVFRCVVVTWPLRAAQVQEKFWGVLACLGVWFVAGVWIAPMLAMVSVTELPGKTYCLDFASMVREAEYPDEERWYSWLLTILGFLLPLVVVFICYMVIVKKLTANLSSNTACRTRARRVIVLILVVFVLCFLPYHVLRALRIELSHEPSQSLSHQLSQEEWRQCLVERVVHAAYIVSRPLAGFNTFFNLALYTMSGDQFREALPTIFFWKKKSPSLRNLVVGTDSPP